MYLTRSGSRFRFQIRVPSDLTDKLGKTPIRLALGCVSLSRAYKMARLLAGQAEQLFIAARSSELGGMKMVDLRGLIIEQLVEMLTATVDEAVENARAPRRCSSKGTESFQAEASEEVVPARKGNRSQIENSRRANPRGPGAGSDN